MTRRAAGVEAFRVFAYVVAPIATVAVFNRPDNLERVIKARPYITYAREQGPAFDFPALEAEAAKEAVELRGKSVVS